jgi:hypothetical protein
LNFSRKNSALWSRSPPEMPEAFWYGKFSNAKID